VSVHGCCQQLFSGAGGYCLSVLLEYISNYQVQPFDARGHLAIIQEALDAIDAASTQ
jgi:hypothetical protein